MAQDFPTVEDWAKAYGANEAAATGGVQDAGGQAIDPAAIAAAAAAGGVTGALPGPGSELGAAVNAASAGALGGIGDSGSGGDGQGGGQVPPGPVFPGALGLPSVAPSAGGGGQVPGYGQGQAPGAPDAGAVLAGQAAQVSAELAELARGAAAAGSPAAPYLQQAQSALATAIQVGFGGGAGLPAVQLPGFGGQVQASGQGGGAPLIQGVPPGVGSLVQAGTSFASDFLGRQGGTAGEIGRGIGAVAPGFARAFLGGG